MLGGKQTLRSFIVEWKEHYAKVHDLDFTSLTSMLRAIDREFGSCHARVPRERLAARSSVG